MDTFSIAAYILLTNTYADVPPLPDRLSFLSFILLPLLFPLLALVVQPLRKVYDQLLGIPRTSASPQGRPRPLFRDLAPNVLLGRPFKGIIKTFSSPLHGMRVLITGGTGYLGGHILLSLLSHEPVDANTLPLRVLLGNNIREVMYTYNASSPIDLARSPLGKTWRSSSPPIVHAERVDLSDADAMDKLIGAFQPDLILHTAAMCNTAMCERDPGAADMVNRGGAENLIRACIKLNQQQILRQNNGRTGCFVIFMSTDWIYDGTGKVG